MIKWEYKITRYFYDETPGNAELNSFGEEGWELVDIIERPEYHYQYTFKRQLTND